MSTDHSLSKASQPPLIGITMKESIDEKLHTLRKTYPVAVAQAGGIPAPIPTLLSPEIVHYWVEHLDGLILAGGEDIHPRYFNQSVSPACGRIYEARDALELELLQQFEATGKPILAICRGVQVLNVYRGGNLIQDLPDAGYHTIQHRVPITAEVTGHKVTIYPGSKLASIMEVHGEVGTNSLHHQAIDHLGKGLEITARSPDGVIEAVEDPSHPFLIGVQWHPEMMVHEEPFQARIFSGLIQACTQSAKTVS